MNLPELSKIKFFHCLPSILFWSLSLLVPGLALGQTIPQWDRDFGGNIWEELNSIEQTSDGGYILVGFSSSSQNGDFTGISNGSGDYWLVKTDDQGIIEWDNNYGGSGLERPWSVQQTTDGGYIIGGYSPSDVGGDKSAPSRGGDDYWVVKVDAAGTLEWDSTYGGDNLDHLYSLIQTSDGGYLLGGRSLSGISGEKTEANIGSWDNWLVKIDANGAVEWDKTLGGSDEELLNMVQEAPDGSYYVGGGIRSDFDGQDVNSNLIGVKDFWFLNISSIDGSILWERRYGGTDEDELQAFVQTQDGGFLLGGGSRSDISPDKSQNAFGIVDMWVIKTDAAGVREWDQTFGGDNLDNLYSLSQNSVGYYVLGGYTGSAPGSGNLQSTNKGGWDYLLVYLDNNGDYKWDQTFGGDQNDVLENVFQTSDGGYVLAGHSSTDVSGDKTEPTKGLNDFWMIKTACSVVVDFADTIVCPNQPVELNAYTGSNCLDCVWEWGDVATGDSIRVIESPVPGTYSVTLVDGVGCSRTDEISIDIYNTTTVEIGDSIALCDGENTLLDATTPGAVQYEWSTGEMSPDLLVDTAAVYAVTVTDNNGCELLDSINVTVGALPVVDLGNDTTLCAGATLTLDAGNPGATYSWLPTGLTTQTITVDEPGVYNVIVDDNGCLGADELVLSNFEEPYLLSLDAMCNDSNTFYVVTFEIAGGDAGTYVVNGGSGNLVGSVFTSAPIPKDDPYSFTFDDGNGCGPVVVDGAFDCACMSDAGALDLSPVNICGNELATFTTVIPPVLDNNDVLTYILHDGTNNMLGTILDNAAIAEFSFLPGAMNYGQTYFVTTVVGNDNGAGEVLLEDGCLSMGEGVPLTFYEPPTALITPLTSLSITCDEPSLVLDGAFSSAPSGTLEYFWEATDGGNISSPTADEPNIELDEPGTYILTVTNLPGGCTDTAMVVVVGADDLPVINIETPEVLTCLREEVVIDASASSGGPGFDVMWSGGALGGNTSLTPVVTSGGTYTLTIINTANGCPASQMVTVQEDNDDPVIDLDISYALDCLTEEAELTLDILSVGGFDVVWSTDDGNLEIDLNPLTPTATMAGTYEVLVTDLVNGCTTEATTLVTENPETPEGALYSIVAPTCYGENDASITVDSVIGGTPGYLYSFDGAPFSATPFALGLEAGSYPIVIQDLNGCEWETELLVLDPQPLVVELGDPTIYVDLGDSLHLQALVNLPLDTFIWTSQFPLSCLDCLDPWITPVHETFVNIAVVDTFGCTTTDQLTIVVQKDRNIYIPNAFSPNGDGANDYFTVYGERGVAHVNYLRVFDRWGEIVFAKEDLPINFDAEGWDGKMKGKVLDAGVFIYTAEVEFIDGYKVLYSGDVTIVK